MAILPARRKFLPPAPRARAVGAVHGIGKVVVVLQFLASVLLRRDDTAMPPNAAYVCSFGVHEGASVDAPQLRTR